MGFELNYFTGAIIAVIVIMGVGRIAEWIARGHCSPWYIYVGGGTALFWNSGDTNTAIAYLLMSLSVVLFTRLLTGYIRTSQPQGRTPYNPYKTQSLIDTVFQSGIPMLPWAKDSAGIDAQDSREHASKIIREHIHRKDSRLRK